MSGTRQLPVSPTASRIGGAEPPGLLFLILGLAFGLTLLALGSAIYAVQGSVSSAASLLPVGYAFAAGMVATVNPCGVLLLPSLVAYSLSRDEVGPLPVTARIGQGIALGGMATLGFVAIFSLVGLVIALGGRALGAWFPVGGMIVGGSLTALGIWLALTGRPLGFMVATRAMELVPAGQDLRSLFLFGVGYGVASLGCTLPIFLVVASLALATRDPIFALSQFVSYALGMGLVLSIVVLGTTFFQSAVRRWIRRIVPYVHRLAAAFLIGAGIYVFDYWLKAAGFVP